MQCVLEQDILLCCVLVAVFFLTTHMVLQKGARNVFEEFDKKEKKNEE